LTRGVDQPEVEGYQWDGWKLIMIAKLNSNGTFHSRKWSCVWRPDVGSSLYARSDWMRAGGVGGVAWLQTGAVQSYSYGTGSAEAHVPLADHMGNVRHYYQFKASGSKVIGQLVASYEYDAFGREVRAWGLNTPATNQPPGLPASRPWADLLPFHYSSKLRDVDSGFNYYGYRFYDPGAGRWLNRDPIGERGGLNLYGMVGNDAVGRVDVLGLDGIDPILVFDHREADANEPTPEGADPSQPAPLNLKDIVKIASGKAKNRNMCCIDNLVIRTHGTRSLWYLSNGVKTDELWMPGITPESMGAARPKDMEQVGRYMHDTLKQLKTPFCKPCTIWIQACNSFAFMQTPINGKTAGAILAEATGCTVKAIKGYCHSTSPRDPTKAIHSRRGLDGKRPLIPGSLDGPGKYDEFNPPEKK
jgi:RHS repeat-associated protein